MKKALTIAILAGIAGGCAPSVHAPGHDPDSRLRTLSQSETKGSSWRSLDLPAPLRHDLAPLFANTIDTDGTPLDAVVERLAAERSAMKSDPAPEPVDRTEALRAYAEGRARLLDGDAAGAVTSLTRAAQLDAGSPEVWRELAEAQLRTGARQSSYRSFQRAVELGMSDPRSLELLGRFASERGDDAEAARLFASALLASPSEVDPALGFVLHFQLAQVLPRGSRASLEALRHAVDAPEDFLVGSPYRAEIASIIQARPRLLRDLGDEFARRRDLAESERCYARAAASSDDPIAVLSRRVVLHLAAGRPSRAAIIFLDSLSASAPTPIDERPIALARVLARSSAAPHFRDALDRLALERSADARTTERVWWLRLRAAGASPQDARVILAQALLADPSLHTLAREWCATFAPSDASRARSEGVELTRGGIDPDDIAEALAAQSSPDSLRSAARRGRGDARPLAAAIARTLGEPTTAASILGDASPADSTDVHLARVRTFASLGDWPAAERAAAHLTADAHRHALALARLQRFADALLVIEPDMERMARGEDGPPGVFLFGVDLALGLGDTARATRWLDAARKADPFDDRVYRRLLAHHGASGHAPNSPAFNEALREARRFAPDSRLVRAFHATELVQRGQADAAWDVLVRLADEDPADDETHSLVLLAMAQRQKPADEAWLRSLAAANPRHDAPAALLARHLAAAGRALEAEALLRTRAPGSATLARQLEDLIRTDPTRADEADRLALDRLAREPRTIEASLELAALLARSNRADEAPEIMSRSIPPRATLLGGQAQQVALAMESLQRSHPIAFLHAAGLLVERGIVLRAPWHQRRLELLAESSSVDDLLQAVDDAITQHPGLDLTPYALVTTRLLDARRRDAALSFTLLAAQRKQRDELWVAAFRAAGLIGDADDARLLASLAAESEAIGLILNATGGPDPQPITGSEPSELVYRVANLAWSVGRIDESLDLYRVALEIDPAHAWANNNLGYFLLESEGDLAEAERCLERAYQRLPDNPSVLDSLGWLRFIQGRLEDSIEPGARRMGAVTLLRIATTLPEGRINSTILDHYADALWASGQREAAIRYWVAGEARALQRVEILSQNPDTGEPEVRDRELAEFRAKAERIRTKIEAARSGGSPELGARVRSP